jgi:hypothetical protein
LTAPDDRSQDRPHDRRAIAALVTAYARHADARDFDALGALFTEQGTLTIHDGDPETTEPVRRRHGRAEIVAAMQGLRVYDATHHMLGQHSAWFDATDRARASGETYCTATHLRLDGNDNDNDKGPGAIAPRRTLRTMAIRYLDDYVIVDGTWRIASRRLAVAWSDDRPIT